MDKIVKIYYINLRSRYDRNIEMINELNRLNIGKDKIYRYDGIYYSKNPSVSCNLSHAQALHEAYDCGYDNVLILEDDFNFVDDIGLVNRNILYFFEEVGNDGWDGCLLSYKRDKLDISKDYVNSGGKIDNIVGICGGFDGCSGYLVNRNAMMILSECLLNSAFDLEESGDIKYRNDMIWHMVMNNDRWFYFKDRLGYERRSYSDIKYCMDN